MSNELRNKIGVLASEAVKLAMESGLTWDESVAAFGVASKALAYKAASQGDGSNHDCQLHAVKRFRQGMEQEVEVIVGKLH